MLAERCAETVNSLAYRPGWTIVAQVVPEEFRDSVGGDVIVMFDVDTVDTNRECARDGYSTPKHLEVPSVISSEIFDSPNEVYGMILAQIMDLEMHETREFLRVKSDDYAAPFHPHRAEGNKLFTEYFG